MPESSMAAVAFNRGIDVRVAGQPTTENPYRDDMDGLHSAWNRGWREAEKYYGVDNRRRSIRRLPEVRA